MSYKSVDIRNVEHPKFKLKNNEKLEISIDHLQLFSKCIQSNLSVFYFRQKR